DFLRRHVTETTVAPLVVQAPPPDEVQVTDRRCAVDRQTTGGPQCLPVSCERLVTLNPCHGLRPPWPTHQKGASSSPSPHSSPNSPPSSAVAACCSLGQSRKRTLSATTSVTHRLLPSCAVSLRFCTRPSTATRRPLFRLWAHASAGFRHVTTGKKSVSRSPC